jgi:hypothetical protein
MSRFLLAIIGLALAAQPAALLLWGHATYLWIQTFEAAGAAVALLLYGVRLRRRDSRLSRWPPLFPLAAIAAAGATKNLFVLTQPTTPIWVAVVLLSAVAWFLISSLAIWRAQGRTR